MTTHAQNLSPEEDLRDLLPDHVAADMVLRKVEDERSIPFHPRFMLQCLESGWWPWSDDLTRSSPLGKLLRLQAPLSAPYGFIARVQRALRTGVKMLNLLLGYAEQIDGGLQSLSDFPAVRYLKVRDMDDGHSLGKSPMEIGTLASHLQPLPALDELGVFLGDDNTPPNDVAYLAPLSVLQGLTSLSVDFLCAQSPSSTFDQASLRVLFQGLSRLQSLGLYAKSTDTEMLPLLYPLAGTLTSLSLSLRKESDPGPLGLRLLAPLLRLRRLSIQSCTVTEDSFHDHPMALEELSLSGCVIESLCGVSVLSLALTSLEVSGSRLADDKLAHLAPLTGLRCLKLSYNPNITDEGIQHIARLTHLTMLDLEMTGTSCNAPCLSSLLSLRITLLTNLERLDVRGPGDSNFDPYNHSLDVSYNVDALLDQLSLSLRRLTRLSLEVSSTNPPSDTAVLHLTRLRRLRTVGLYFDNYWMGGGLPSQEAIEELRRCNPGLNVCCVDHTYYTPTESLDSESESSD